MNGFFKDKVVWITGASSGIGAELAKQLSNQGAQCILSSRDDVKLKALLSHLPNNSRHLVLPLDLKQPTDFEQKVQEVVKHYGRIDILINNGGISQRANARDTLMDVDREIMDVNYFGPVALTKAALPVLKQSRAQIIVISSVAGKFGFHLRSAYSASKHALHGFFESLALEEADSIRVSMVCPGKINTDISLNALNEKGEAHQIMDPNHETGMSVERCVEKILTAVRKGKSEVLMGGREVWAVYIKRYFPALFRYLMRQQKPA